MSNESGYTDFGSVIDSEIISRTINKAILENSVGLGVCTVYDIGSQPTRTVSVPISPGVTVSTKSTDETALSNSAFTFTSVELTVGEFGHLATITDMAKESSVIDIVAEVASEAAAGLLDKLDTTVLALAAGHTVTAGTTTVNPTHLTMLTALASHKTYAKGFSSPQSSVFIWHPQTTLDLRTESFSSPSNGLSPVFSRGDVDNIFSTSPGAQKALIGSFCGVPILESSSIPTMNTGADRANCLITIPGLAGTTAAWGLAVKWMPRVEMGRDIANGYNADKVMSIIAFAASELRDYLGITIIADA